MLNPAVKAISKIGTFSGVRPKVAYSEILSDAKFDSVIETIFNYQL